MKGAEPGPEALLLEAERRRILDAYERRRAAGRDGGWFGHEDEPHFLRLEQRHRLTRRLLDRADLVSLEGLRVLDVGCGAGDGLLTLVAWGARPANLAGIDLRSSSIDRARDRLPAADWCVGCASDLPWAPRSFDLVIASTLFSSVLEPAMRRQIAEEMARVLHGAGAVLIYDSVRENPRNPDVQALAAGELLRLFPRFEGVSQRLTFLPHWTGLMPLAWLRAAYPWLASVPFLTSHRLTLLRRPR